MHSVGDEFASRFAFKPTELGIEICLDLVNVVALSFDDNFDSKKRASL